MKVIVNGMVIEGTPQEVTTFLHMYKLVPSGQTEKIETVGVHPTAVNMMIYREIGKKTYRTNIF